MKYSAIGLAMTEEFEGLRLQVYADIAGVLTIGYGHTGLDVHPDLEITQSHAEELLHEDLASAVTCVNLAVTEPISQSQFDAMVDFCFNAGRGNFLQSTLLRKANLGDFAGAAAQFGLWVHAGGEVVPGLVRRRKAEAELFSGERTAIA